jgi:hypothetical protein
LIEVAHEPAVEMGVSEGPAERASVRIALAPEVEQLAGKRVGGEGDLGGLRGEELGEATVAGSEVAVDPAEVGGLPEVGCEALEEVLRFGIDDAKGAKQAAVLEHADVNRAQHPEDRRAAGKEVGPDGEIVPDALIGVERPRAVLDRTRRKDLSADVSGDALREGGERRSEGRDRIGGHQLFFGLGSKPRTISVPG